jgi:hypothetical protein
MQKIDWNSPKFKNNPRIHHSWIKKELLSSETQDDTSESIWEQQNLCSNFNFIQDFPEISFSQRMSPHFSTLPSQVLPKDQQNHSNFPFRSPLNSRKISSTSQQIIQSINSATNSPQSRVQNDHNWIFITRLSGLIEFSIPTAHDSLRERKIEIDELFGGRERASLALLVSQKFKCSGGKLNRK